MIREMLLVHWVMPKQTVSLLTYLNILVLNYIKQFVFRTKITRLRYSFYGFSDEEKLFGGTAPDPEWEEFAIVAADLLERIQSSMSYNNTPYASESEDDSEDDEIANSDVMKMSKTGFKMWLANS